MEFLSHEDREELELPRAGAAPRAALLSSVEKQMRERARAAARREGFGLGLCGLCGAVPWPCTSFPRRWRLPSLEAVCGSWESC